MLLTDQLYWLLFYFCSQEKSRLKLTSAKVEVEVEAELGNYKICKNLLHKIVHNDSVFGKGEYIMRISQEQDRIVTNKLTQMDVL